MRMKGKKVIFNAQDTYSLYEVLSPVIYEGLKKFKEVILLPENENHTGVPSTILREYFPEFDNGVLEGKHIDKWHEVLDTMIYAFEDKEPDMEDYAFSMKMNSHPTEHEEYVRATIEVEGEAEHLRYKEDMNKHNDKVSEGLELFGKYYAALWW